jgi:hypothetical protein
MTTITIDRSLIEQALVSLSAPNHCVFSEPQICIDLRASLAAPATAPAQPEIVDLLAEMYELILANKVVLAEKSGGVWTWPDRAIEAVRKHRSGPAQPERKPMTDDETLALFDRVKVRMLFTDAEVAPFASGVAAAEHFHGIGDKT